MTVDINREIYAQYPIYRKPAQEIINAMQIDVGFKWGGYSLIALGVILSFVTWYCDTQFDRFDAPSYWDPNLDEYVDPGADWLCGAIFGGMGAGGAGIAGIWMAIAGFCLEAVKESELKKITDKEITPKQLMTDLLAEGSHNLELVTKHIAGQPEDKAKFEKDDLVALVKEAFEQNAPINILRGCLKELVQLPNQNEIRYEIQPLIETCVEKIAATELSQDFDQFTDDQKANFEACIPAFSLVNKNRILNGLANPLNHAIVRRVIAKTPQEQISEILQEPVMNYSEKGVMLSGDRAKIIIVYAIKSQNENLARLGLNSINEEQLQLFFAQYAQVENEGACLVNFLNRLSGDTKVKIIDFWFWNLSRSNNNKERRAEFLKVDQNLRKAIGEIIYAQGNPNVKAALTEVQQLHDKARAGGQ